VEIVEDALLDGASLQMPADDAVRSGAAPGALIAVCSEQGFTGAFNELLLERALAELAPGEQLGIIGRRGALLADERGMPVTWQFPMATHVAGVVGTTRAVASNLSGVGAVRIIYARYSGAAGYSIETRAILPLDPSLLKRNTGRGAPLHHLAPAILLDTLADEYLFAEFTRGVMESFASESAAQLMVMESADHRIGERLEILGREQHALRQAAITTELLDVVLAAESVMGRPF
jgi:F-type H+-transporting ATPase subunit gamma